jgi:hypothetical protein
MPNEAEMIITPDLRSSSSFKKDFKETFSLEQKLLDKIANFLDAEDSLDIAPEDYKRVAASVDLPMDKIRSIINVIRYLHVKSLFDGIKQEAAVKEICDFAETLSLTDCVTKVKSIERIFAFQDKFDKKILAQQTATFGVQFFRGIKSSCDLRVVEDSQKRIFGLVPVGIIEFTLYKNKMHESSISFQLDENDIEKSIKELEELKNLLQRAKEKLGDTIITI